MTHQPDAFPLLFPAESNDVQALLDIHRRLKLAADFTCGKCYDTGALPCGWAVSNCHVRVHCCSCDAGRARALANLRRPLGQMRG